MSKKLSDTYDRLRIMAAKTIFVLFAFTVIACIFDDWFFGDRIKGGIDPLFYGLVGTLITLIFTGKKFLNGDKKNE